MSASPRAGALVAALGAALGVAAAAGCDGGPAFDPPWRLHAFRVLGVHTEPADPLAGTSVLLELATADPLGRHVTARWWLCEGRSGETAGQAPLPDAGLDASADAAVAVLTDDQLVPDCPRALELGSGERLRIDVPRDGATRATTTSTPMARLPFHETFRLAGFACAGGVIVPAHGFDGGVRCEGPRAAGMLFTTLLYARSQYGDGPNENPGVRAEFGETMAELPAPGQGPPPRVPRCTAGGDERVFDSRSECPVYRYAVVLLPTNANMFTVRDADGGVHRLNESLAAQAFVSAGAFSNQFPSQRTELPAGAVMPLEWRAPRDPGAVTFVATAQDDRGAFTAVVRQVVVE